MRALAMLALLPLMASPARADVALTPGSGAGAFDNSTLINQAQFSTPMPTITSAWYNTSGFTITVPDVADYVVGNSYGFAGFSGPLAPMNGVFVAGAKGSNTVVFYTNAMGGSQSPTSTGIGAVANYTPTKINLPPGTFHVANSVNVYSGSCIVGTNQTYFDVDMDFSPLAGGIINVAGSTAVNARPCVKGVNIVEHTPPDVMAKPSAATGSGVSSVIVNTPSNGKVTVGMYATSTSGAIKGANLGPPATVTSVINNGATLTIGLSIPTTANLATTDTLYFAQSRTGFSPLGSCNTVVPGGAPCQYPWAIYAPSVNQLTLDDVFLANVYNGIYIRGSTFHLGYIQVGAYNIGLDLDKSFNFPQVDDYEFWSFGLSDISHNAIANNYYDGVVVAANIGETDGVGWGKLQSWDAVVNFTSNFTWGHFDSIMLDGDDAGLNVGACQWAQIDKIYATKSYVSNRPALNYSISSSVVNTNTGGNNSHCQTTINNWFSTNVSPSYNNIVMNAPNAALSILGGYMWNGIWGNTPEIIETAGRLKLANLAFDCGSPVSNYPYITQTGGSLSFTNNSFVCAPSSGDIALSLTDTAMNLVSGDNIFNGWLFTPPGTKGKYAQ